MATLFQRDATLLKLKDYKRKYIKKQFAELDESATRIMTNSFLTEVLGYKELDEIKTEYNIRGEYADYVVQLARKKQFVIEVKSIQIDLSDKHLRQSMSYAANEGIDWIILTNGRSFQIYRVIFNKPIRNELLINMDLLNASPAQLKNYADVLVLFTKKAVLKNEHEQYWLRSVALSPKNLSKLLYSEEVVRMIKREIKKNNGIYIEPETIKESLKLALGKAVDIETIRFKNN